MTRALLLVGGAIWLCAPLGAQQIVDVSTDTIEGLATTVSEANMPEDFRRSLLATLSNAQQIYTREEPRRAIDQLLYFSAEVRLQTPSGIESETSEMLQDRAAGIIGALSSGLRLGGSMVGPAGATLRVSDPKSPFHTAELRIPPNAIDERIFVSITVADGPRGHPWLRFPGGGLSLGPEGLSLKRPAVLVLPSPDVDSDRRVDGEDFPLGVLQVGAADRSGRIGFLRTSWDAGTGSRSVAIHTFSEYWNVAWRVPGTETLTYKFQWPASSASSVAVAPGHDLDSLKARVRQGIEVWNAALVQAGLGFEEVGENEPAAVRFGFFSTDLDRDSAGRVTGALLEPLERGLGEGIAQVWANQDPSSAGAYFDIAFNATLDGLAAQGLVWTPENRGVASAVPIELVALHAVGHVLGLGHGPESGASPLPIMSARTDLLQPEVCLSPSDVSALRALYDAIPTSASFPGCPHATVSTSSDAFDFGSVEVGAEASTRITLRNSGEGTLHITDIFTEGVAPGFSLDLAETQRMLRPGDVTAFDARFVPERRVGATRAVVRIASNALDSPTAIDLRGTVPQDPPTCTLNATPAEVMAGTPVVLGWSATSLPALGTIAPAVGDVEPGGGQHEVTPSEPTEYTLSVSNSAGTATCSTLVNVITVPSAAEIWRTQFGTAGDDGVWTIFGNDAGVFIAGETRGSPGSLGTAFVGHYDRDGEIRWTDQIPGARAEGISASESGVYVVGVIDSALADQVHLGSWDVFVLKYALDGTLLWFRQFGTGARDRAVAVAADGTGVSIAGITEGMLPGQIHQGSGDAFVRKYDAEGTELWTAQFGTSGADFSRGIAMAPSGEVFVAGDTAGVLAGQSSRGASDGFLRAYDANGEELWTVQFGEVQNDFVEGVALGSDGIYVTGESQEPSADAAAYDVFIRKYSFDGTTLVWTDRFGTPGLGDFAANVSVDLTAPSERVYVGGETYGVFPGETPAGDVDLFLRRYTREGEAVWTRQYGSSGPDDGFDVATDATGVYVAGSTGGSMQGFENTGSLDAFVLKISK